MEQRPDVREPGRVVAQLPGSRCDASRPGLRPRGRRGPGSLSRRPCLALRSRSVGSQHNKPRASIACGGGCRRGPGSTGTSRERESWTASWNDAPTRTSSSTTAFARLARSRLRSSSALAGSQTGKPQKQHAPADKQRRTSVGLRDQRQRCFHARLSHKRPSGARGGRRSPRRGRFGLGVPFSTSSRATCGTPAHANPFVRQPHAVAEASCQPAKTAPPRPERNPSSTFWLVCGKGSVHCPRLSEFLLPLHVHLSGASQPTSRAGHRRLRAEPRRDWARR